MLNYLSLVVNLEVENMTRSIEVDIKTMAVNTIRDFNTIQPLQKEKRHFHPFRRHLLLISVFILTQVKDLKDLFLYLLSICREVKPLPFYNAMRYCEPWSPSIHWDFRNAYQFHIIFSLQFLHSLSNHKIRDGRGV